MVHHHVMLALTCLAVLPRCEACGQGEYLDNTTCRPCQDGMFQDLVDHQNTECRNCSSPNRYDHEYVISNCSRFADVELGCRTGYYRTCGAPDVCDCDRCTSCRAGVEYDARPCGPVTDALCCPLGSRLVNCTSGHVCADEKAYTKQVNLTHKEITETDEFSIILTCAVAGYPRDITLLRVSDGAILKVKTPAHCTSLVHMDYFLYPTCGDMTRYRCLVNYRDGQTEDAALELSHDACTDEPIIN
ncbi:uncharacterized protein LOC131947212 [Physella acuta]|uniref:uncharacterized protein LOC131947212 n=1 Tax=Physella acuta TaxID=109671 RepID=UPI0027DD08F9|nr:uncharacterized protein LOC131947212 [Physella acuta]